MLPASDTDGRNTHRYERKFIVPRHLEHKLVSMLSSGNAGFREIFTRRTVNNVYFDTPAFRFFNENRQGYPYREKVRVRWYGETTTPQQPRLEIKRRSGLVGTKDVFPLRHVPPLWTGTSFTRITEQAPDIRQAAYLNLIPVLFNRYVRRYLLSADARFRVTIDSKLAYYHPHQLQQKQHQPADVDDLVLELKYAGEHDSLADNITARWPFRLAKKSKYVSGVCSLYVLPE